MGLRKSLCANNYTGLKGKAPKREAALAKGTKPSELRQSGPVRADLAVTHRDRKNSRSASFSVDLSFSNLSVTCSASPR